VHRCTNFGVSPGQVNMHFRNTKFQNPIKKCPHVLESRFFTFHLSNSGKSYAEYKGLSSDEGVDFLNKFGVVAEKFVIGD
jgi:hypothetical protein